MTGQEASAANAYPAATITDLLSLIDGLDRVDDDCYLDVTWWDRHGSGDDDERLTLVIRRMAREHLDSFSVEDVGMEILRRIDQRPPRYKMEVESSG